jgi:sec-independent protein translocase protein TatA
MPELLVVLVIVVVLFGANKLPQIGAGIGKGIRNFKDATKESDKKDEIEDKDKKDTGSDKS